MKKAFRKLQQSLQTSSQRSSLSQSRTTGDEDEDDSCCAAGVFSRTSLSSEVPSAICTEQTSFNDLGVASAVHSSPVHSPVECRPAQRSCTHTSLSIDVGASNSSPVATSETCSKPSELQQTTCASSVGRHQMAEGAAGNSVNASSGPFSNLSMGMLRTGLTLQARADSGNHDWGSVAESPLMASPQRLQSEAFVIAVAGGTASGKTTVCNLIMQRLHDQVVAMLPQDAFYKDLTPEEHERAKLGNYNFDSPEAIDEDLMLKCIDTLRDGRPCNLPVYDYSKHARSRGQKRRVEPAQVILVEGILTLHFRSVLSRAHMKIFVDSDDDVRLARRIQRDVMERGRSMEDVLQQYARFVKPSHDDYIAPSKRIADIVIPWHKSDNLVAVDLIVGHVQSQLVKDVLLVQNHNLHLLDSTFQMRGMHTIIRDKTTSKGDFIFFADRLIRLVIEYALGLLPTQQKRVGTPTQSPYIGEQVQANVCGVSIIRSGEAMEAALRSCWKGIDIGKILVHRRHDPSPKAPPSSENPHGRSSPDRHEQPSPIARDINGNYYRRNQVGEEPDDLIYEKLPHDIANRHVLLMDPILGTGNTVARALQVLLSKGCKPSNIVFCTLIASRQGINHVCSAFPDIKVITTEIDRSVDSNFRVVPGIGEFGDRYFCC